MSLAERLARPEPPRRSCSVGKLLDRLEGEELDALLAMLYGPGRSRASRKAALEVDGDAGWSKARIWRELAEEGYDVSEQMIGRHRSDSGCKCPRALP